METLEFLKFVFILNVEWRYKSSISHLITIFSIQFAFVADGSPSSLALSERKEISFFILCLRVISIMKLQCMNSKLIYQLHFQWLMLLLLYLIEFYTVAVFYFHY